jgi:carbon-monoxide dehydrogenase large subunit
VVEAQPRVRGDEQLIPPGVVVGQPVPRVDALEKVLGKAQYTVDLVLPHMLYGRFLRSPFARARILRIDTSRARRVPGVRAVVTGEDFPYTYGSTVKDRPFLARGEVRYVGEPVVAVAATSLEAAEEALSLIAVEYEPLEPLLDPEVAMQPGAPLIHPDLGQYKHSEAAYPVPGTNICSHYRLRRGDVEEGFREADFVYENTYRTQMVQHVCIEPHAAIAQWQPASRRLTVWVGTVSPFMSRKELADGLGIPMSHIRVIVPRVGGSFGSKMYLKAEPVAVALAWFTDGRPVKVVFDREDEFYVAVKGPTITRIKTGVKRDGSLTARQVETIWDTGAYADCGPRVTRNSGHTSPGPYRIPHVRVDGYTVYTNKNVSVPFRGYGTQEMCWAYETHMDEIAAEMGWDPLEFRLRNALRPGDLTATGQEVDSWGLVQCLEKVRVATGWGMTPRRTGAGGDAGERKVRGWGVACIHKATGAPSTSSAVVKLNEDGTVTLLTSTVEQGQGSETVLAQMVAEELGVRLEDVFVSPPDTDYTPFDSSSTSSRSTYHMGNAIRLACDDVKRQLVELAAKLFKVEPERLEVAGGVVRVRDDPGRSIALRDIVLKYYGYRGGTIIGRGVYRPQTISPDRETGQTPKMTPFWMYGVQAAEVEVDLETGKVEVLRIVAYHDVGRAINPTTCKQQLEGAVVMGMSGALLEDVVLDRRGKTLNVNLHDYKAATAIDCPLIEVGLVESVQLDGPFGAKGVGEPALAATAPAIGNAVYAACGIRIRDLPITPEKLLAALKKERA